MLLLPIAFFHDKLHCERTLDTVAVVKGTVVKLLQTTRTVSSVRVSEMLVLCFVKSPACTN